MEIYVEWAQIYFDRLTKFVLAIFITHRYIHLNIYPHIYAHLLAQYSNRFIYDLVPYLCN